MHPTEPPPYTPRRMERHYNNPDPQSPDLDGYDQMTSGDKVIVYLVRENSRGKVKREWFEAEVRRTERTSFPHPFHPRAWRVKVKTDVHSHDVVTYCDSYGQGDYCVPATANTRLQAQNLRDMMG